jgi:hypothetical protein
MTDIRGFVFSHPPCGRELQNFLAAPGGGREARPRRLHLLVHVVLGKRRELQCLGGEVGVQVSQRGLQAGVRQGHLGRCRFAADLRAGGGLAERTLLRGHPLLAHSDTLHGHGISGGAKAVRAGDGQVLDSDAEHWVGQLPGSARCLSSARGASTRSTHGLRAPDGELERLL